MVFGWLKVALWFCVGWAHGEKAGRSGDNCMVIGAGAIGGLHWFSAETGFDTDREKWLASPT
jgi:hypothetical protein